MTDDRRSVLQGVSGQSEGKWELDLDYRVVKGEEGGGG